jgi:hypothetical protein
MDLLKRAPLMELSVLSVGFAGRIQARKKSSVKNGVRDHQEEVLLVPKRN